MEQNAGPTDTDRDQPRLDHDAYDSTRLSHPYSSRLIREDDTIRTSSCIAGLRTPTEIEGVVQIA